MDLYRKPYFLLFNAITDALDAMEKQNFGQVRDLLIQAHQSAEELILSQADEKEDGQ